MKPHDVQHPSSKLSLSFLEQTRIDNYGSPGGHEYDEESVDRLIQAKRQAKADKDIREATRGWTALDFNGPDIVRHDGIFRTVVMPPYPVTKRNLTIEIPDDLKPAMYRESWLSSFLGAFIAPSVGRIGT